MPLTIEEAVRAIALAHPGLTALNGGRFYYGFLPDGCALPANTFYLVDDPHDHVTDLGHARIQIASWGHGPGYVEAAALDRQADDAFTRFKGIVGDIEIAQGVTATGPRDLPPETVDGQERTGRTRDVIFIYRGA